MTRLEGRAVIKALMMHPNDDVAVVTAPVSKGDIITYVRGSNEMTVAALSDIPVYHKIAVRHTYKGDTIRKYGEIIGHATVEIEAGGHVHTHNLSDLVPKAGDAL